MAQVLKPTPVAQADFGRKLKPAPAAKLFVFSYFSFALASRKVLFVFCISKSTLCGAKSTTVVASKVRFTRQSKVDFGFLVAYQSPLHAAQSRLRFFKLHLKSILLAFKVDFGRI
jgi:hypothetical protein